MAWWLTPRIPDAEVGGSSPTRVAVLSESESESESEKFTGETSKMTITHQGFRPLRNIVHLINWSKTIGLITIVDILRLGVGCHRVSIWWYSCGMIDMNVCIWLM